MRIQEKARGAGFDWEDPAQVWQKVQEELAEFGAEYGHGQPPADAAQAARATQEFGDLLFSLVNFARFAGINPEEALERTNRKFIARFQHLEAAVTQSGQALGDLPLAELDVYWNAAKAAGL
jgi:XTP/dITP diphosphohydrolase